ncbi:MAG TPA: peptidoglycan binding domain-containing protein, partial [Aggregatilineaceae bacterium]|nr:peptidoglycan binding domain-containing protein [Aggregatilineaceae bacterium]
MDTIQVSPVPHTPPERTPIMAWLIRLALLGTTALLLLLFLGILFVAIRQVQYRGLVYPGLSAYGINLSGMTKAQAVDALSAKFTFGKTAIFTFRDGGKVWQHSAAELGVRLDPQKAVDMAYAWGRDSSLLGNVIHQAQALLEGYTVEADVVYDQSAASGFLKSVAAEIDRPTKDASILITGTIVNSTAGQIGRQLDIPATLGNLRPAILNLNTGGEIPLIIKESKPAILESQGAADKVRAALSGPIDLYIAA